MDILVLGDPDRTAGLNGQIPLQGPSRIAWSDRPGIIIQGIWVAIGEFYQGAVE